jgi:hypothetical protein
MAGDFRSPMPIQSIADAHGPHHIPPMIPGSGAGRTIRRYRFRGRRPDGRPDFDRTNPESRPWPADFELVRRVIYEKGTDSLYLFGYLKGQPIETWGVVGRTARRYDG